MIIPVRKPLGESKMGLTHVAVELRKLASEKEPSRNCFTARFLVDTGALDSMVSASELRRIGIEPVGKRVYELDRKSVV